MSQQNSSSPIDTNGKPLSTTELVRDCIKQSYLRFKDNKSAHQDDSRINMLVRKMHMVRKVSLPIPNFVAFQQIQKISRDDPIAFVAEAVFILFNQQNEDMLFLHGEERAKAIAKCSMQLHIHHVMDYFICISEMIKAVEKKTKLFTAQQSSTLQDLLSQLPSFFSQKPSEDQSVTS